MNERKFLKQINSKVNKDGIFTCSIVLNLINSQTEEIGLQKKSKTQNIFRKMFSNFGKKKTVKHIIEDNFDEILEKTKDSDLDLLIINLIEKPEFQHLIMDKLPIILNRLIEDATALRINDKELFEKILEFPEGKEYINQNIDTLLEKMPINKMFQFSQYLKGFSDNVDNKLNELLRNNKVEIAKQLLEDCIILRSNLYTQELLDKYKLTLSIMIDELIESENCREKGDRRYRYIDINYLNRGTYSDIFQIGSKVIKIGGPRETYAMPNHRRILQPLIRTNFIDEKNRNIPFACIEISEKVEPLLEEDMDEEKMYEIFKELREAGIICTDFKLPNLGRLNKKNVPSLNGEQIDVAPNSVGFTTDEPEDNVLDSGEIVIIDTDYIYNEGETNIIWQEKGYSKAFERRYQQEKAAKIAKEFSGKEKTTEIKIKEEQKEEKGD